MTYMEETAGIIEKRTQLNLSSSMVVTFHTTLSYFILESDIHEEETPA